MISVAFAPANAGVGDFVAKIQGLGYTIYNYASDTPPWEAVTLYVNQSSTSTDDLKLWETARCTFLPQWVTTQMTLVIPKDCRPTLLEARIRSFIPL